LSKQALEEAQKKVKEYEENGKFSNNQDPDRSYNDNIWAMNSASATRLTPEKVLTEWENEAKSYDYGRNYFSDNTGHFTQMVSPQMISQTFRSLVLYNL